MQPLVSIIIPTYNRARLIGETIDSVLAQTYENWECIVVDDGSTDATNELMEFYTAINTRIKYFRRPPDRPKGANACRNFGFEVSKGKYIQWLDSDDLLMPDSLKCKTEKIEECNCDFVVAKLINFSSECNIPQFYNRSSNEIKFEDFLFRKINWITPDPLISSEVLELNHIRFNEAMQSDQEYNYFCKLLSRTTNGVYIDQVLTRRRIHSASIQSEIIRSDPKYSISLFRNRYLTFLDLQNEMSEKIKQRYLNQMMTIYFFAVEKKVFPIRENFYTILIRNKGFFRFVIFWLALKTNLVLGKGYVLLQISKNKSI